MASVTNFSSQSGVGQTTESTNGPQATWCAAVLSSREKDNRRQPWEKMFDEEMNTRTGRDPDFGTYDECAAQDNGGGE